MIRGVKMFKELSNCILINFSKNRNNVDIGEIICLQFVILHCLVLERSKGFRRLLRHIKHVESKAPEKGP